jgi:hypothetical protein
MIVSVYTYEVIWTWNYVLCQNKPKKNFYLFMSSPCLQSWSCDYPAWSSEHFQKTTSIKKTRGASHCDLAIYIKKSILRQKKNYGNSNISPCKNIIFQKKSTKRNQHPSRYHNSITNSSFNTSQNIIFQKSSYTNRPILPRWPKSLKLLYSIMNLNTISLPW